MRTLFIITGPTAVGKTEASLRIAEHIGSPIISADSRQLYRNIPIGTAAPTSEELSRVHHYFVGELPLDAYYSAAQYEHDSLEVINRLFQSHEALVVSGGSYMYIDALRHGLDSIPTISPDIRERIKQQLATEGLQSLCEQLRELDPKSWNDIDKQNPRRVVHALEVCVQTGNPYSSYLNHSNTKRDFRCITIALCRPTDELYERINLRVDQMMSDGLEDEALRAMPFRQETALNTVGYKEMFDYFDGRISLQQAVEDIKSHTRNYARKQYTWLRRDNSVVWFHPQHVQSILRMIDEIR